MFGHRVARIEDPALLRGRGTYVDDIHLPGMVHAHFVRSPHAHAVLVSIDRAAAAAVPGVVGVYTLDDLRGHVSCERLPVGMPSGALKQTVDPWILARDEVCHVGEAYAVILAESRYAAEDAAARLDPVFEPLAAAGDCRDALRADAPRAHQSSPDNVVAAFALAYGETEAAFARAAHVFREDFFQHKGGGQAIECRGVVARHDAARNLTTVWSGTQMAHRAHGLLVQILGCAETELRVIAPDVGGGFGPKFIFYAEEAVVPALARATGRPVKWIEDRREHFVSATQERDQYWSVEIAVDGDGRMLGVRGSMIHDHGAYSAYGVNLPYNSSTNFIGPYILPALRLDVTLVLTNKVSVTPVRGAGRPQGTFAMERLLDRVARELGLDRTEVRRRNLVPADRMPYTVPITTRDGSTMTYDSGDYPEALARALAAAGYAAFPARQEAARRAGRHLGLGVANYVEGTGRGPFEAATVRIGPSGRVFVFTGATAQGQGLKTALAQICADRLGVAPADITVVAGDSAATPLGLGAFASRQAVTAGNSVRIAADAIRDKAIRIAALRLEAAEDDLELAGGRVRVKGSDMAVSLADIARSVAGMPGFALPGGVTPGMEATSNFQPATLTYCNGTHVCEVEVDVETGAVHILRYVVVHDSGRLINPMIVDGQVIGGTVHGIGSALYEWMGYDDGAQPVTTTLAEYLLPTAPELPRIDVHHMESPSLTNPLGVKGAGEGGTIPATAVIASAVENALAPFGVRITDTPITPPALLARIRAAAQA
ncbi:MAG: xanthine dehydrogenase family protein molybdopterin-binding subunit [Alphaproteobacteria bacterium]|nr:xanthine dehydrogenase family protein molybdopterin-binding subunit [Alphaproteobacteria bacterium]